MTLKNETILCGLALISGSLGFYYGLHLIGESIILNKILKFYVYGSYLLFLWLIPRLHAYIGDRDPDSEAVIKEQIKLVMLSFALLALMELPLILSLYG